MLYQLYSNARGFLVTGLVDKGWSFTLSFLQKIGQLNAVYAVASEGSLPERVERFNKLRAPGTASEQDKNSFAEGLLLTDPSGRTILCDTASNIVWNSNAFNNMLGELEKLGFFSGSQAEKRMEYFLEALFRYDSDGRSAFLYALEDQRFNSLSLLLTKLFKDSGIYPAYGEYFIELIKENHHFLFRTAAQSIASYLLIRQALLKSGCTSSQLQQLLNTTHNQVVFQKEIACTPLMTIIYNTIRYSQSNYADFTALLLRFRADGAQLTEEQVLSMRKHLEKLKGIVHVSPVHLDLLNDWIEAIQVIENPKPVTQGASAPKIKISSGSLPTIVEKKKVKTASMVIRDITEEPSDEDESPAFRALNLV